MAGEKMKTGLVLEGGAMRGMYTAGVLDIMLENNIVVDGIVGVSAGAAFGCNYKSKQIGRAIRYNTAYCKDPRYLSFRSLIKTGDLYGEQFCYHEIPNVLDPFDRKTYAENPVDFYVTCTDVHTGKPVYQLCNKGDDEDIQWMRASASMPLVSRVVSIGGYDLLDGGISDSIPISWFRSIGYEKNIVILTQPEGFRKKKSSGISLAKLALKKYPAVIDAMEKRHEIYNSALDELYRLKEAGNTFVLQPSKKIKIKRTEKNPDVLRAQYQLGRKDALQNLETMREFVGQSGELTPVYSDGGLK